MKIKEGFVLRQVAGQGMVIAVGEASKEFHGMVKLNETGSKIWQGFADGLDQVQIAEKLADEYDVTLEKATADVEAFVIKMKKTGFIVEE